MSHRPERDDRVEPARPARRIPAEEDADQAREQHGADHGLRLDQQRPAEPRRNGQRHAEPGEDADQAADGRQRLTGAGVGMKGPDGPIVELAPGKYKFSIKTAGKPPSNDEITVGADETWGVMIGPGGALPLRVY